MSPNALTDAALLVIDDNPVNVELLLSILEDEGFEQLHGMTDPRQVLSRLEQQLPDLIFLDIRMPHLNGLDLLKQLGERFGEAMPPVIVLTANTDQETRYQALELGARDFLTKPFDSKEVIKRLNNILQEHAKHQQQVYRAEELESLVKLRTAELKRMAVEDSLTGLPNRPGLLELLHEKLLSRRPLMVVFFAMDGLDEMARLHGLEVADQLTLALRDKAKSQLLPDDVLGVWGSNEWVLIRPLQAGADTSIQALAQRLDSLLESVREPIHFNEFSLRLNVRLGVSSNLGDRSAETLIRLAALAVPDQPNAWRDYSPELEDLLQKKVTLQSELSHAAARGELELVYQPKVQTADGRCFSAEALLRWKNPVLGRVSPADFIPQAEATGQILELGRWVQRQACRQLKHWLNQGVVDQNFSLAVNVASLQLIQPDFAEHWLAELKAADLPPQALEVEVTESGLMENMQEALKQLQTLAEQGVPIAIDDFGTGYSSLAYLKRLPISVLKIDRAFIVDMHEVEEDFKLVATIMQLANNFGFATVAEGVENEHQVEALRKLNCDLIQGYFFSPPLQAARLQGYLQQLHKD